MEETEILEPDTLWSGFVNYTVGHADNENVGRGFLAHLADGATDPGVILIQEWWGIEPHIQDLARRLAREHFVVLAPDLYHGEVATEPDEARKAAMELDQIRAVREIRDGMDYLQSRHDVAPKKLGVVGFCMGGTLAWHVAEQDTGAVGAVAAFYAGFFRPTAEQMEKVTAPVLAVWGSRDPSISAEEREQITGLLEQQKKTHRTLIYDAGHAFMNDTHPTYDAAAAAQAWQELLAWLNQHLRK